MYYTAENQMRKEKEKELFNLVYMMTGKRNLSFFLFFIPVRRKKQSKKKIFSLPLTLSVVSYSDITCSHLIASSDRLV
jgi:hypothetical protein